MLAIAVFALTTTIFAQPQKMAYQTVVRNANNELVVNQTVGIKATVLHDSINGVAVYVETHSTATNANGLATIEIGNGTPVLTLTSLADVDWKNHRTFLKIDIDPTGGINYTITGVQELLSVPYAFYAETTSQVDSALYANNAGNAVNAIYSDTALYSINADSAIFANNSGSAQNAINAIYSDTSLYATSSNHSLYADTALYANNSNNSINAINATYSDTSLYATNSNHSVYADTALYANNSANSVNAHNAVNATYADTAFFLMNAQNSDTAKFAYHSDSANYATTANYSNTAATAVNATYSDTSIYSNNSTYSTNSLNAAHSDTANYATNANAANTANTALSATYADTADYNKLRNRPIGANHGDILYWESSDSSWHIVPVGNIGETLTLDSSKTPHWSSASTTTVTLPTITTDSVINITTNSARAMGTVSADGGSPFVFSGLCWGTAQNPTTSDFHTLDGIGLGSVSSNIPSLTMGTVYYVRAFATNSAGTAYGNEISFRTQTYPVVVTGSVSNISTYAAISGGNVTDDGGATVTARGVCWSTSIAPTTADSHTTDGIGAGTFLSSLSPLARNTKYYVRAYATNYIGTTYGDTVSFTTLADYPTVTTSAVSSITSVTAVVGGNVTDDGDATVTARGICWNSTGNPTLADNVLPIGSGYGSFSSTLTGLTASTVYYVCAYATNSIGTSYGATISFTTADPWTCGVNTITDYDNNVYNTVQIGTQCWMRENLKTEHYADGTSIPLSNSSSTSEKYRYYPGASSSNVATYGYLYNWSATMNGSTSSSANPSGIQGVCPTGWHIPSSDEWTQLTDYVSTQNAFICGSTSTYIAKSLASTTGWTSTSSSDCVVGNDFTTNNATNFSGMPAGRNYSSTSGGFGTRADYWSTTDDGSTNAYRRYLDYNYAYVYNGTRGKHYFLSVRCLKD